MSVTDMNYIIRNLISPLGEIKRDNHPCQLKHTAILLLLLFAGCRDESIAPDAGVDNTDLSNGTSPITLTLNTGEMSRPVVGTRAVEGIDIDKDVWVIVFDGNDDNATFRDIYFAQGGTRIGTTPAPANQGIYSYQFMAPTIDTPVRLLILANTPERVLPTTPPYFSPGDINNNNPAFSDSTSYAFTEAYIKTLLVGKTYADAVNTHLNAPMLGIKSSDHKVFDPTEGRYQTSAEFVPMSGKVDLAKLNPTISIGTVAAPVMLTRCVAKITLTIEATNYTLEHITAFAMPMNGSYCEPTSGTSLRNSHLNVGHYAAGSIHGVPTAVGSNTSTPLYVYEHYFDPADYDPVAKENRPLIVVRGTYTDKETGMVTPNVWYTLAFPNEQIKRNHHYHFRITAVDIIGNSSSVYPLQIPYQSANALKYNVEVTDLSSHDITRVGDSYVALSNSELYIYQSLNENPRTDLVAAHVATTATSSIAGITLSGGADTNLEKISPASLPLASPYGSPQEYDVVLAIDQTNFTTTPSGFSHIQLGYILFDTTIPISRRSSISKEATVFTDFATDEFVVGEITTTSPWVKLSTSLIANQGLDTLAVNSGGIYLHLEANNTGAPRTAELFFSRRTNKGRLKVVLTQSDQHIEPKYHLFFNGNGGYVTGALPAPYEPGATLFTLPYPYSTDADLPDSWSIYLADHTFIGWSTNPGATPTDADILAPDIPYAITKDQTLYAVWDSQKRVRVAFNLNGGTGTTPAAKLGVPGSGTFGRFPDISVTVIPPAGKSFKGWKSAKVSDGSQSMDIEEAYPFTYTLDDWITPDYMQVAVTLHAIWE